MRKHSWRIIEIAAFVALALLLAVALRRGPVVNRAHYEVLPRGITEQDIEAVIGFGGEDVDGPPFCPAGVVVSPDPGKYRWKRWRSGDSEIRVGFGAGGGLLWKCWVEPGPVNGGNRTRTSIETTYAENSLSSTSHGRQWVEQSGLFDRLLATLRSFLS